MLLLVSLRPVSAGTRITEQIYGAQSRAVIVGFKYKWQLVEAKVLNGMSLKSWSEWSSLPRSRVSSSWWPLLWRAPCSWGVTTDCSSSLCLPTRRERKAHENCPNQKIKDKPSCYHQTYVRTKLERERSVLERHHRASVWAKDSHMHACKASSWHCLSLIVKGFCDANLKSA